LASLSELLSLLLLVVVTNGSLLASRRLVGHYLQVTRSAFQSPTHPPIIVTWRHRNRTCWPVATFSPLRSALRASLGRRSSQRLIEKLATRWAVDRLSSSRCCDPAYRSARASRHTEMRCAWNCCRPTLTNRYMPAWANARRYKALHNLPVYRSASGLYRSVMRTTRPLALEAWSA